MAKKGSKAAKKASAAPPARTPKASDNGAYATAYEAVQHIVRTLSPTGGPWEEQVINPKVANEEMGRRMVDGWDIILCRPLRVQTAGIDIVWLIGKVRQGESGKGFTQVKHVTKVIQPGLSAQLPAVTAARANTEVAEMLADGWTLIEEFTGPLGSYGPEGFPMFYLFCK
jgi:hypothetical protein